MITNSVVNYYLPSFVYNIQEEVMAESKMMIPDCERKLAAARKDLIKLLVCDLLDYCYYCTQTGNVYGG